MKKIFVFIFSMIFLVLFGACNKSIDSNLSLPNPMKNVESLQEINDTLGCHLTSPGVMGVTDQAYYLITGQDYTLGEYDFTVNGVPYTYRFSAGFEEDISGIYVEDGTLFSDASSKDISFASTDSIKAARWFTVDGQYCLTVEDDGAMDMELFKSISEEIRDASLGSVETALTYENIIGAYMDSHSQRASLVAEAAEDGLILTVNWASSDSESDSWVMHAVLGEDGLLFYTGGTHVSIVTGEEEIVTDVASDLGGYFVYTDGILYWSGAPEESCAECVFEKVAFN